MWTLFTKHNQLNLPKKFNNEGRKKAEENTSEKDNDSRKRQEIESQSEREDTGGYSHIHHRARQTRGATLWDK